MRVLSVTYANRVPNNDRLYESLAKLVDLQRVEVDKNQALHLKKTLANFELLDYDRVVIEIRAKHAISQWRDLWKVPNLVLYEEDTWQNYVSFSKNYGYFTKYYQAVQPRRIIHSGFDVAAKTAALGFDSCFLPKGFDGAKLSNIDLPREIEMGFVGRLDHANYVHRKAFLEDLAQREPLKLLRTHSDEEYLATLNRIRFFISADIEFGEHMIKNFEALACGCILFAYRQGGDDAALGFEDMHNVVFYANVEELQRKLEHLRQNHELAERIAANGQQLARDNHDHWHLGQRFHTLLAKPLTMAPAATLAKGGLNAAIAMSDAFYRKHWPHQTSPEFVASLTEQALTFRFFTDPGKRLRPAQARSHRRLQQFLRNTQEFVQQGIRVPNIRFWGTQKDRNLSWVAYDQVSEFAAQDNNFATQLMAYLAALHDAGAAPEVLAPEHLGFDAQHRLICLDPSVMTLKGRPLIDAERHANLQHLTNQSDGLLKQVSDAPGIYAQTVAATDHSAAQNP